MAPTRKKMKAEKSASIIPRPKIKAWSVVFIVASLVALYGLLPRFQQLDGTTAALKTASPLWVLAAIAMTVLLFLASGYAQYVASQGAGSLKKLTTLELTGAFIDHFMPFNAGSVSLIARYYRQLGMTWSQALTVSLYPTVFGIISTLALVMIISPVTLSHLFNHTFDIRIVLAGLAIAVAAASVTLLVAAPLRRRIQAAAVNVLKGITALPLWPVLVQLVLATVSIRVAGGLALAFAVYSVHASITLIDAFTVFVAAQIVFSLSPTPGGVGTTEAFLVVGLSSVGISLPYAIAASLVFRLVTFWLPIIPGMIAVHFAYRWQSAHD
jgi:uncharacterized protein (TIRG00374 family)